MSKRWTSEPVGDVEAADDSAIPLSQFTAISRQEKSMRQGAGHLDGFVESHSILEFFDFRFRRYLTPAILRISWLLVLAIAAIWLLIVSYAYVSSLIQNREIEFGMSSNAVADSTGPAGIAFPAVSPFFVKTGIFLSSIVSVCLALMWIRVFLESFLMLFGIGKTLRAMKDRDF